jgi:hypothetical protein
LDPGPAPSCRHFGKFLTRKAIYDAIGNEEAGWWKQRPQPS